MVPSASLPVARLAATPAAALQGAADADGDVDFPNSGDFPQTRALPQLHAGASNQTTLGLARGVADPRSADAHEPLRPDVSCLAFQAADVDLQFSELVPQEDSCISGFQDRVADPGVAHEAETCRQTPALAEEQLRPGSERGASWPARDPESEAERERENNEGQ